MITGLLYGSFTIPLAPITSPYDMRGFAIAVGITPTDDWQSEVQTGGIDCDNWPSALNSLNSHLPYVSPLGETFTRRVYSSENLAIDFGPNSISGVTFEGPQQFTYALPDPEPLPETLEKFIVDLTAQNNGSNVAVTQLSGVFRKGAENPDTNSAVYTLESTRWVGDELLLHAGEFSSIYLSPSAGAGVLQFTTSIDVTIQNVPLEATIYFASVNTPACEIPTSSLSSKTNQGFVEYNPLFPETQNVLKLPESQTTKLANHTLPLGAFLK